MKSVVTLNAIGMAASASMNLLLTNWTRSELLKNPTFGHLPMPVLTLKIFNHPYSLFLPTIIYIQSSARKGHDSLINRYSTRYNHHHEHNSHVRMFITVDSSCSLKV
jgi:hypothetical protein